MKYPHSGHLGSTPSSLMMMVAFGCQRQKCRYILCLSRPPPGHPAIGYSFLRAFAIAIWYVPLSSSSLPEYFVLFSPWISLMCLDIDCRNMIFPHILHASFSLVFSLRVHRVPTIFLYYSLDIAFVAGTPPAIMSFVFFSFIFNPIFRNRLTSAFRSCCRSSGVLFSISPSSA